MDIKIKDKDISTGDNGYPERIEGLEEYLQRAFISLTAKKGRFCYLRELGAFKELGSIENPKELIREAEAALSGMNGIGIKEVKKENGRTVFTFITPFGEGEVRI